MDVGGGAGRKKPKPLKKSEHHALMGIVIQAVLEQMYNQELWRHPGVVAKLKVLADQHFQIALARRHIDFRQASREEMMEIIWSGVVGYLRTFKAHKLAGQYARSEREYIAYVNKWNPIGGKLDFLIRRSDEPLQGITILDGKNSTHKGKYTDPDQLRFYALCFYLAESVMPDRLGFVYFRYPHGFVPPEEEWETDEEDNPIQPEPDSGIEWIPFTKRDLKGLAQRAVDARRAMDKRQFDATPSPPYCKFCDYETVCPERQAQIAKNRRKPKNQEELFDGAEGFIDFGIGEGGSAKGLSG